MNGKANITHQVSGYNEWWRRSLVADVAIVATELCAADRLEMAASRVNVQLSLHGALSQGDCCTMTDPKDGGHPMGMFGVLPADDPSMGIVWALTTDRLRKYRRPFHVISNAWIEETQDAFPVLTNFIWAGNLQHILWLRRLGFIFLREVETRGVPFYEFARTRACANQQQL